MTYENELRTLPWSKLSQTWGHPWHAMCSYLGSYPASLARALICMLSDSGDTVLDPFSGRGTTLLEARLLGRRALATDLNPISVALTNAKNLRVEKSAILERLEGLRSKYDPALYLPEAHVQPDDIQLIFDGFTLAQLCFLRRHLVNSDLPEDQFLVGVLLGIMHGSVRQDGTSAYLSISMPNTFSMSPGYVKRFVQTNRVERVARNAFEVCAQKLERLFRDGSVNAESGIVAAANVRELVKCKQVSKFKGKVDLILTSPPYLDIVNYGKQNWIRNWFLDGCAAYGSVEDLDDNLILREWMPFIDASLKQMRKMLRPGGIIAMVIGDVVRAGSAISLAREFIQRLKHREEFKYIGCLSDHIQGDIKTTRIWKETKGKATNIDRIVVLSDETPKIKYKRLAKALFNDAMADIPKITASKLRQEAISFAG